MKRFFCVFIALVLIVVMSLSMAACGAKEATPTEALDSYLKGIQKNGINAEDIDLGEMANSEETKEFASEILEKMTEFDYTLSNEKIDGESATVDVNIKTYGFGDMLTEVLSEYIQQAFVMAFSDASEEEMTALFKKLLNEKMNVLEKNYDNTVTVEMIKGENGWELKDTSTENPLYDALLGGLYTSIENMGEAFGSNS